MKEEQPSLKKILQPYLLISIAGLLAFAPVSFMLRSLKNDIIALEYPINHFISQSLHNGEIPYWFNTWGMGFPLQSNLTWGIFSTPQMLFCSLFNYSIYTLHIEFMIFVLLAGWTMFYLLQKHILKDQKLSQLLAICYMLSGFMVGSTQWLLYITAAAFIPLIISSLLSLLKTPSLKKSIQFAIIYTLMFTSVYAAFNIITTYSLIIFVLLWFLFFEKEKQKRIASFKYLGVTAFFTLLLCFPSLYYTMEVLQNIGRGSSIAADVGFFNSNYLHPYSLSNLLLPFSSVKMNFPNTEGTMLHTYMGLFILLLLPLAVWRTVKEKNRAALFLLIGGLLFLLTSFGAITPVRNIINILPGFTYFRNPAIFRLYFIVAVIIFAALTFQNKNFSKIFFLLDQESKTMFRLVWLLLGICLIVIFLNINSLEKFSFNNFTNFVRNINYNSSLLISSIIQACFLIVILLLIKSKRQDLLRITFTLDLIINTLICTPFFSVSSSSISEVSTILLPSKGFPLQTKDLEDVATTYMDSKNNTWHNINIFRKEVSTKDAYRGPLTLNNFYSNSKSAKTNISKNKPSIVYINEPTEHSVQLLIQRPTSIKASVKVAVSCTLTVMQNYYAGWKAFYNKKEVEIIRDSKLGMSIKIPPGEGFVEFKYERKLVWLAAIALHLIVILFFIWKGINCIRKYKAKSPSLS